MNRFFAFILFLLVTIAVVTPCCLYDDCAAEQTTAQKNTKENSEGTCSPFFACSTCSGFVWTSKHVQLPEPVVKQVIHFERPFSDHLQIIYTSFWQPPRVV